MSEHTSVSQVDLEQLQEAIEDIARLHDLATRFYFNGTADQCDGDSCFVCGGTLDGYADNDGHRDDCDDDGIAIFLGFVKHKYQFIAENLSIPVPIFPIP